MQTQTTKIDSFQKQHGTGKIVSAHLPLVMYDTMLKIAELTGYTTVSAFVKDAVCDKVKNISLAVSEIAVENKSNYTPFDPTTEFWGEKFYWH